MTRGRLVALGTVLPLLAVACTHSARTDPALTGSVVAEGPRGYSLDRAASGWLKQNQVATAIAVAPAETHALLQQFGFSGAHVQVWTRGTSFARLLRIHLPASVAVATLLEDIRRALRDAPGAVTFPVNVAGPATGYLLSGRARNGAPTLFCQGVLFAIGLIAYEVDACSPDRPGAIDAALALARRQAAAIPAPTDVRSP